MSSTEDHQLVARVVSANDTHAFGELIRRHQSQVRNFLRKLTRDPVAADDLAQDCFLHAWDKLQTYSGSGSFIGWLLKVAYTTFLQSRRKAKRYGEILEESAQQTIAMSASYTSPVDEVTDLDRLMSILTEEERAILVMSYGCGLSHREISEATGQPAGTIKSIIFRSKEKIRAGFEIEDHQHG